jgi:hypothetical protein
MFTQLNPTIPVNVISKDSKKGYAFGVIDYSQEHNLLFVVALDEDGSVWCVSNSEIRLQANWSLSAQRKNINS